MKVLLNIFSIPVHFFGMMIALGILAGIFVAYLEVKRKRLDVEKLFDLTLYSIISAVIGARVFYILFYDLSYYLDNPAEILRINEGGLSIHGGLLGAFVFAFFYFRKHPKLNFYQYADVMAPGIILGQGIGRIGCDVFGKVMSLPFPWGIEHQGRLLHPVQVYEFLLDYLVFFILWRKRKSVRYNGQLFIWYVALFSINRSIIELFRLNPTVAGGLSIAHLLGLVLMIVAVLLRYSAKRKMGNVLPDKIAGAFHSRRGWVKDTLFTLALMIASALIFFTIQSQ